MNEGEMKEMNNETYWNLLNDDLLLEFIQWLRTQRPLTFRRLINQFIISKEKENNEVPLVL
jgi:hypothetical protein